MTLTVQHLVNENDLELTLVAGDQGLDRPINSPELNRPTTELSGWFDCFRPERLQVMGTGEILFIESHLHLPDILANIERLFEYALPCIIVTGGLSIPETLISLGNKTGIPVFSTPHQTTRFYKRCYDVLEHHFSPTTLIHGNLLEVYGVGVLIVGSSGVGKSETALELISKGHILVADDTVRVVCLSEKHLEGSCPQPTRNLIEVRGLGIIDVSVLYGVRSVRTRKAVNLVITLREWSEDFMLDRSGLETQTYDILGVKLPHLVIPVKPGRHLATIVEVGARNLRAQQIGIQPAHQLNERIIKRSLESQMTHQEML